MKRLRFIIPILVIMGFVFGISFVSAQTIYDDFSGNYIDSDKWTDQEFVREVSQGKLIMKVSNSTAEEGIRNRTVFMDPASIDVIECNLTVNTAILDTGSNQESFARINGRFYNTLAGATEKGDIWAGLYLGNRGNGIEAWWEIHEATDDTGDTWEEKGSGTLAVPGLNYGLTYTLKIDYNGNNGFTFTVGGVNGSFSGPVRGAAANTAYKALESVVSTEGGSGSGYVSATFDNILVDEANYDDFSTSQLDQTKWQNTEFVREIESGKLRLISNSIGDRENTHLHFSEIHPYVGATVRVHSSSAIDTGDRGIARIDGFFYNDTYGPDSYNGYEGNVWVGFYINYFGDGTLTAACSGDRTKDAADTDWDNLFYREFNLPIVTNRDYKLSIQFTDNDLRFIIKDTVTGRMDVFGYEITTPIYKPYDEYMTILSRVYGNSTGGCMVVEIDDVYTNVAEPAATYDAGGKWELIASNSWATGMCDLPAVGDTVDITITQNGNDLTVVGHDDDGDTTLNGYVYGDTYTFINTEVDGNETEITYGIIVLSDNDSGSGNMSVLWMDGIDRCESGFDITITKLPFADFINVPQDYTTIQGAIDAAVNGDTVIIADGTYTGIGNRDIDFNGKAITVKSENGPNNCIIDCEGEGRGFYFHNSETQTSILSGITITNGYADRGGGIRCSSSPIVTNCRIIGNNAENSGGGLYLALYSCRVTNCIIAGNSAPIGAAVYCGNTNSQMINCTMTGNTATSSGVIGISSMAGVVPTIINCILWDDPNIFHFTGFPEPIDISYCALNSTEIEGATIFNSNPLFVNVSGTFPLEWDLHLQPTSPYIDIGNNSAVGMPSTDIEGNPRIFDGNNDGTATVDLGADEYVGDTQATVTGTLTLPTEANGKEYIVAIDTDTEGSNGYIAATVGTCGSGTTVNYSITNVPEGTYYLWAVVRINSAHDSQTAYGDFIGFYGTGLNPPSSANAIVPDSGSVNLNFSLSLWDPSDLCPNDPDKTDPGVCGCGVPDTDSDNDGIPDCVEEDAPNGGDGNDDGTYDSHQSNVVSLTIYDGQSYLTLELSGITSMGACETFENPSPTDTPADVDFQYDFLSFIINGVAVGGTTTVILYLPDGAEPYTYYKYGKTPDNPTPHWYEFLYDGETGAEINGDVITLYFVDGKRGDDDLAINGIISDIGGPGFTASPAGSDGDDGDDDNGFCFFNSLSH